MIDPDVLYMRGIMPCACGECGWNDDGTLVIVDRYALDWPPIPRFSADAFIEVYRCGAALDPDDRISFCPVCDSELDRENCIERKEG